MRKYGKLLVLVLALAMVMPVVSGAQAALECVVIVDNPQLVFGEDEAISYRWTITGGQAPYQVHINIPYTGGNAYYDTQSYAVNSFEGRLPLSEMMYFTSGEMFLVVEDAAGNSASSNTVSITLQDNAPVSGSVSLSNTIMAPGDSVVATGSMTGGKPPYTFYSAALSYPKPDDPMYFTPTVVPVNGKVSFVIPADAQPGGAGFRIDARDSAGRVLYLNAFGAVVASGASTLPGDANGDKLLNISDLEDMIDYLVKGTMPSAPVNAAPVRDGEIDIQDAMGVIDRLVEA